MVQVKDHMLDVSRVGILAIIIMAVQTACPALKLHYFTHNEAGLCYCHLVAQTCPLRPMCAIHRDSLIALFQTGGAEKGSDYKFQGKSSAVSADIYGSDLT